MGFPRTVACAHRVVHRSERAIVPAGGEAGPHGTEKGDDDRYRALVEEIPAIVYIWSVVGGLDESIEEYISPQVTEFLGYAPDEWTSNPHLWIDLLHPDDRDEVLDETTRSVDAGEGFRLEYRMIARNGEVVWLHDVANVLTLDQAGHATRYAGVQFDITDRKRSEHAQRRNPGLMGVAVGGGDPEHRPAAEALDPLSEREHEVAELLALGHTNAEIAAILRLSVRTIEHHRARVFRKLGVRSRAGLVQELRGARPSGPIAE
jgi:PAS domain S-box-containing protein